MAHSRSCLRFVLVAACCFVLPTPAFGRGTSVTRRFLQEDDPEVPLVNYQKLPGIPSEEMVVEQNEAAKTADQWAATAQAVSALHAEAAENLEAAKTSELIVKAQGLKLNSATMQAIVAAQKATEMKKRADAAVMRSQELVQEMPSIARKAAERAVDDAIHGAIERMDMEAALVAKAQAEAEKKLAQQAAKAAELAALPWQQAKLRAGQTMISYISQGRDLTNAAAQLKLNAPEIAKQAGIMQSRGDIVHAQEYQIAAHDLLDKADQLHGQAVGFDKTARQIQGTLGMFDLSASAAAAYASYTANPGGGVGGSDLPPLPFPLKLANLAGPGPAPAPAPAAAV